MENGIQCVHDNAWNLDDATVVCHQLGYSGAWTAYYQPGEGLVKVEEPQCTGEETTLLDFETSQSMVTVHSAAMVEMMLWTASHHHMV